MDFDRLLEFAAVAKHGSIKKAAQELNLSCAALSARLIGVEEYLGTQLFVRTRSCLVLTPAGRQLLPSALEILSSCHRIQRELHAAQEHAYHQLRIAITGSTLPLYLGPFLDQLNISHPGIRIELLDDTRFGIVDGLQSGAVDIYFAPVMDHFAPKGLSKNYVSVPTAFVIMPRSHPLADHAMVSIQELDREQFILYPPTAESAIRDFQLCNLQDAGIHYTLYDGETSTLFYKLLVPIGKGLLLRPTPMMDVPPNAVCLPVTGLPHPAVMCFFFDSANPKADVQAFARDFPNFAKEVAQHEHRQTL